MNELLIYGVGGHGRSSADVILANNPRAKLVFIDDNAKDNEQLLGFAVVKDYRGKESESFVAIGDNVKRGGKYAELSERYIITVKSNKAYVSGSAQIGRGCFVGNFCHIGPETVIGNGSIINTAAVVEHEVRIGAFCHLAPHSCICGRTNIGNYVFIGAGATVIDKISICSEVLIGAGAVVVENISESGTYFGVPARKRAGPATQPL